MNKLKEAMGITIKGSELGGGELHPDPFSLSILRIKTDHESLLSRQWPVASLLHLPPFVL